MNILNKGTIIGFAVGFLSLAGLVYAATSITSLSQTATTGDKITAQWVNAVNTRLNEVTSVDAAGKDELVSCSRAGGYGTLCVWSDGSCRILEGVWNGWKDCGNVNAGRK